MLKRSRTDQGIDPAGAHILVASDDPDACQVTAGFLEQRGFRVTRSNDVEDAVVKVGTVDPHVDLVLLEFRSGGTSNGLKLLDRLRAHDDEAMSQVRVALTSDVDENRGFSWQSGVDEFLVRPYHIDELIDALVACLGRTDEQRIAFRQEMIQLGNDPRTRRAAGEPI